jgi:hypothetical protein
VFVSYAHDDEAHRRAVLAPADLLERNGLEVVLDQWAEGDRKDWGAWADEHIRSADFVLVIASPDYRRVGDGTVRTTDNRGVQSEAALIRELLHDHREAWLPKMLPVVLPGRSVDEIPTFLQPRSADHYEVPALDQNGVEHLLRTITGQPNRVPPPRGQVPHLPPRPLETSIAPQGGEPRWAVIAEPAAVQWREGLLRDRWWRRDARIACSAQSKRCTAGQTDWLRHGRRPGVVTAAAWPCCETDSAVRGSRCRQPPSAASSISKMSRRDWQLRLSHSLSWTSRAPTKLRWQLAWHRVRWCGRGRWQIVTRRAAASPSGPQTTPGWLRTRSFLGWTWPLLRTPWLRSLPHG